MVAFPLCKYNARRGGLSCRSRVGSEQTPQLAVVAVHKRSEIFLFWFIGDLHLAVFQTEFEVTYNKKRIYNRAIE